MLCKLFTAHWFLGGASKLPRVEHVYRIKVELVKYDCCLSAALPFRCASNYPAWPNGPDGAVKILGIRLHLL